MDRFSQLIIIVDAELKKHNQLQWTSDEDNIIKIKESINDKVCITVSVPFDKEVVQSYTMSAMLIANELAKRIGCVFKDMSGRIIADYTPPVTFKKEQPEKIQNKKIDPVLITNKIIEKIKKQVEVKIPELSELIKDEFIEYIPTEERQKFEAMIYSIIMTTTILTMNSVVTAFTEEMSDK